LKIRDGYSKWQPYRTLERSLKKSLRPKKGGLPCLRQAGKVLECGFFDLKETIPVIDNQVI
jgi:hypothetical protein